MRTKDQKFDAICRKCLEILATQSPSRVNIAKVARSCDVSRAWIYKYIAKNSHDLILAAIRVETERFVRGFPRDILEIKGRSAWISHFISGVEELLEDSQECSHVVDVYFKYKGSNCFIGHCIRDLETKYIDKKDAPLISRVFKMPLTRARVLSRLLVSFRMGLAHSWATESYKGQNLRPHLRKEIRRWIVGALR